MLAHESRVLRGAVAALVLLASMVLAGCPPKRDLTRPQVDRVERIDELMWFLATVADPGFKLTSKDPQALVTADYLRFADIGRRVPWGAARLKTPRFSRGRSFEVHADALSRAAEDVGQAVARRDGAAAQQAARRMKRACSSCHKQHR